MKPISHPVTERENWGTEISWETNYVYYPSKRNTFYNNKIYLRMRIHQRDSKKGYVNWYSFLVMNRSFILLNGFSFIFQPRNMQTLQIIQNMVTWINNTKNLNEKEISLRPKCKVSIRPLYKRHIWNLNSSFRMDWNEQISFRLLKKEGRIHQFNRENNSTCNKETRLVTHIEESGCMEN